MKATCFVICPIGASGSPGRVRSDKLLQYIIEPVCSESGYSVVRADRLADPGMITNQIMEYLVDADLVIADLTDMNPNVFYELGVRHCTGKPFIQVMYEKSIVPFDIANVRTIPYSTDIAEVHKSVDDLRASVDWILKNPGKTINPVLLARNIGTLLGGNSTEQSLGQLLELLTRTYSDLTDIKRTINYSIDGASSIDDVESAVSDLEDEIKRVGRKVEDVETLIGDIRLGIK